MKSISHAKIETLCNASMTDQITNDTSAIWISSERSILLVIFMYFITRQRSAEHGIYRDLL